jgi:hypothetical protein
MNVSKASGFMSRVRKEAGKGERFLSVRRVSAESVKSTRFRQTKTDREEFFRPRSGVSIGAIQIISLER